MTGYTHHWDCRICLNSQETICNPAIPVCNECIRPIANQMCCNALGQTLKAEGVDIQYWMAKATRMVDLLMRRWVQRPHKQPILEAPKVEIVDG